MKSFFKNVLATLVALMIAGIIGMFLLGVFVGILSASASDSFILEENTVLTLNLEGTLNDRNVEENPFTDIFPIEEVSTVGLDDILLAIKKAKENEKIKGIYLKSGMFQASSASVSEIRTALQDFKQSGKFVIAYGDMYTQPCYYLSSVADKVILNPLGNLDFHGMTASPTFFKSLLDKVGVEMQIFKVGTYKSAVEPYMLDKMSDANREQLTTFVTDVWGNVLQGISESRKISIEELNALADTMPLLQEQAFLVEKKMVDTLMYETEVMDYLKTLVGIDSKDKLVQATIKNMKSVPLKEVNTEKEEIAVLYAQGGIKSGNQIQQDAIEDRAMVAEIEKLRKDESVKAVVFRVNSPGGSAFASEQIWKAISDLKAVKPVVVSMGDYAASGGYYISCNATKIIAQPNTLTGSIGIYGMFPNAEGLVKKIGVNVEVVKTNKHGDFGQITRPMREDEKRLLQAYIDRGYETFVSRCAQGRNLSVDSIKSIAQGRIWTGTQALKIGLVDGLGGIDTAIKEAAALAKLEKYSTKNYPRKRDFFETLFSNKKEDVITGIVKEYLGEDYVAIKDMKEIKNQDYIQARMTYDLKIK